MANRCILPLVFLAIMMFPKFSYGELLVIVNKTNPLQELTREQVVNFFMGKEQSFPNAKSVFPIDLPVDSPVRVEFYKILVGKTIAQINAYWARLLFTGSATPPKVLPSAEAVNAAVRDNADAIAYIDSEDFHGSAKIVFRLK
jgi:hypothetical protein